MKISNFGYLVKRGIGSVFRNALMSIASFCVMLISLLLVGMTVLVSMDISVILSNIEEKNEIDVFVYGDVEETVLNHISDSISVNLNTQNVIFYSKSDAWKDEKDKMMDDKPELVKLFEYLPDNPMPHTFKVTVKDISLIAQTADEFRTIDGVEEVTAPYDFSSALVSIRSTLSVIAAALLVIMIVTSVIVVYNSIRSSVFIRKKEINIMKVVGATNSFVKIPFFIEGLFIGILSGVASWGLTKVIYDAVVQLFRDDITIWNIFGLGNLIQFDSITWYVLAANCILGALLGAIGTIISTGKYVKV